MKKVHRVSCVGSGLIGMGWASVFSAGGLDVTIFDVKEGVAEKAIPVIGRTADFVLKNGLSPAESLGSVTAAQTLEEAVSGCEYVQESIFESLPAKRKVFKEISALNPNAVIASSTSSLSISKIQTRAKDPSRCLAVHPLNPVYIMPVVEVVGGKMTSPETLTMARELMTRIGKVPVSLNFEVPGHVIDRLQAALWREALDLLNRGVADAADIDKAVASGLGPRWATMGPYLRAHLAGGEGGLRYYLEHIEPSHYQIWKDMRAWKHAPTKAKRKAVDSVPSLTSGLSYDELVARRDKILLRMIRDAKSSTPLPQHDSAVRQ